MNTAFWAPYISDSTIKAICWTLIHSLWVGIIMALLTALVITLTRKSRANLRYQLLCGTLVLFVLSVSVICYLEMRSTGAKQVKTNNAKLFMGPVYVVVADHSFKTPPINPVKVAINFLDANTNIIFIIWMLFFIMKSLKMVSGLLYIQRIRNYKVHGVAEEFKHKIEVFSIQIGIRRTVRLMQSELVKVPVAVGWLKPMILLPMGIILQLPAEQLDSILWHELAHIRRRDYLANILQGLVETVFFFNPGLLWLSSLIRAEREACCDDMVLSRTNRKANYLEALLAFGYENNSHGALAMSTGGGNQLRNRLKRLINQENKRLSMAEKMVLLVGLVLLSVFTILPKTTQAVKYLSHLMTKKPVAGAISKPVSVKPVVKVPPLSHKPRQFVKDTIVKKPDTSISFTQVLSVLLNKEGHIDMISNDVMASDNKGSLYHLIVAKNKQVVMLYINDWVKAKPLPGYGYMMAHVDQAILKKSRLGKDKIAYTNSGSPAVKSKYQDSIEFAKQKHVYGQDTADMDFKLDSLNYEAQRQRVHNVIAELIQGKVVPDTAAVKWFGLNNTELIVNGEKQPDVLQKKLKAKYGIHRNYGLYYGPVFDKP
jgi:bla regulator protein blaR1